MDLPIALVVICTGGSQGHMKDNEEFYMQRIFSTLKQAFRQNILILALISLVSLSGLFIFATPSLAAPISTEGRKLIQQEQMDKESQTAAQRERDYDEQVKAAENPDRVYEENLKAERKANPDEGIVQKTVEGAKGLVNKVTGNE